MKWCIVLSSMLLLAVLIYSCSDNPVDEENGVDNPAAADSIASYWFRELGDTMMSLEGFDVEEVCDIDLTSIRTGFQLADQTESGNGIAHLGFALIDILELSCNPELRTVVDSIDAWIGSFPKIDPFAGSSRRSLLGRQFSLLVEVPLAVSIRRATAFPQNITMDNLQNIITNEIIPALNSAIGHLSIVESDTDMQLEITFEDDGVDETIVIDLGEIYFLDASMHALRGAFRMATAYDVDLFGLDGTYDWADYVRGISESVIQEEYGYWPCGRYEIISGTEGDTLDVLFVMDPQGEVDSILIEVAYHNITNRPDFLALRDGGAVLASAHNDLQSMITKLDNAVQFIKNRSDESEDNVIKLADLTEMESELGGPDGPNFAQGWSTIEDVLDWARDFISGPMNFDEELGSGGTSFQWTMDISALFDNPVGDWKNLLPYHRWNLPLTPWIAWDVYYEYGGDNSGPITWGFLEDGKCVEKTLYDIVYIREKDANNALIDFPFIEFLDGPGGSVIDLETTFPYFPPEGYTLGGLLPDMNRTRWEELMTILQ